MGGIRGNIHRLDVQKMLESAPHGILVLFAVLTPGPLMILADAHGARTTETLRIHCGIDDPDQLQVSLAEPHPPVGSSKPEEHTFHKA